MRSKSKQVGQPNMDASCTGLWLARSTNVTWNAFRDSLETEKNCRLYRKWISSETETHYCFQPFRFQNMETRNQFTLRLKTRSYVNKKSSFSPLDSSIKQWWIGAHWPTIWPTGRCIHYITWIYPHLAIYFGSPFCLYPTFHTLTRVGRKKAFQHA